MNVNNEAIAGIIRESLPKAMRCSPDTVNAIEKCCESFLAVNLLEAKELAALDGHNLDEEIPVTYIIEAMVALGFKEYVNRALEALNEQQDH